MTRTMNYANVMLYDHPMTISEVFEQGGGLEEITIWCHRCDPTGAKTINVEYRDFADVGELSVGLTALSAMWRTAFLQAERHARNDA